MQACRLAARDLACRRGDRLLFAGLGLALEGGAALQVTGANGIGKSSLLRLLAGLLRPAAGAVTRVGAVALVDERAALDPGLPLGRALGFWAGIDGSSFEGCQRMGLEGVLDVPVGYLSTGQRKRAAFARLLAQDAAIWLLDEPLNGLDADGAALVVELVKAHCQAGGIAVVASHQAFAPAGMAQVALANFTL